MDNNEIKEFFLPFQRDAEDYRDYCESLEEDELVNVCAKHIASSYTLAAIVLHLLDKENETDIEF